jgi:peptidoglycan-associated lipoprotein
VSQPAPGKAAGSRSKASIPISPSVAVSADLAAACGIEERSEVPPNFAYDKTDLLAEDRAVLEQVATCVSSGPLAGRGLTLTGRADPRGTSEYNLGLGAQRARAVSEYLQRLGVKPPQLAETTRGDLDAAGIDEETWQRDRRVDLELRAE